MGARGGGKTREKDRRQSAVRTVASLFAQPAKGSRTRKELDAMIRKERAAWNTGVSEEDEPR